MGRDPLIAELREAATAFASVRSVRSVTDKELRGPFLRTRDALMAAPGGTEVFAGVAGRYLSWENDGEEMEADLIESSLAHCDSHGER